MDPRVEVAEGTAFEVLLGAAAIADDNWRDVFASGPSAYSNALAVAGTTFVRRVQNVGRYGWINLISLLTRTSPPWDLPHLVTAVQECAPAELHFTAIGGDRHQLIEAIPEEIIRAALASDRAARDRLVAAFASDEHILEATSWMMTTSSNAVHDVILDLLQTWRAQLLPPIDEATLSSVLHEHAVAARAELAITTGRSFLERTIGGLHYDPAGFDRVLTIPSPQVAPIVVVVDGRDRRIILHPPLSGTGPGPDSTGRLLALSRAVGDKTRVKLLTELRQGEMTAVELAGALGAPRTTLLHHLAMLRSAGFIHVTVTPGGATIYRLRPDGFSELSQAAAGFMSSE